MWQNISISGNPAYVLERMISLDVIWNIREVLLIITLLEEVQYSSVCVSTRTAVGCQRLQVDRRNENVWWNWQS